ncbi:sigma-54-dependent transcriptional regulator [Candidatus Nitrospira bockiana]
MSEAGVDDPEAQGTEPDRRDAFKALVVEDDDDMRRLIEKVLLHRGHQVTTCADAETGWAVYQGEQYSLVMLDWRLPGMDGLELCRLIRSHPKGARSVIVVITACDQPGDLQKVLSAGANDYVAKPVSLELLKVRVAVAEQAVRNLDRRREAEEALRDQAETVQQLRRQLRDKGQFQEFVGQSKAMRHVYEQIQAFAKVDTTVLIEGETGTGKELVARAIHMLSRRKAGPFIAVNCAALTESLLASQLFGHKKGAFTGAHDHQQGFFEAANGGTLFLDEIGDISPAVQKSLLRVLQDREITRVGEAKPRKVDVRVLAATHHNLGQEVAQGTFRADLLYRIRVARIHLPPLRERREDIPLLVTSCLGESCATTGKRVHEVGAEAMRALMEFAWPGNVRELKSAIESAVLTSATDTIQLEDLPPEILDSIGLMLTPEGQPCDEKARLCAALERAKGNRTLAARLLGMSRATFYRRLSELAPDLKLDG